MQGGDASSHADVLAASGYTVTDDVPAFKAVGCGRCGGTGYKGRVGLYEVMDVNEEIRSLVMREGSGDAIAAAAVAAGMQTLRDDGLAEGPRRRHVARGGRARRRVVGTAPWQDGPAEGTGLTGCSPVR